MTDTTSTTLSSSELSSHLTLQLNTAQGCQRILHGRGRVFDGLHAINIEWYPPYLFVQNFDKTLPSVVEEALRLTFENCPQVSAILVQSREWPDFISTVFVAREEVELPLKCPVKLAEGLVCEVSLGKNRNTGVFLDMRAGWHWLQNNAANKRVLNLFSYTGVFSLFALKGGASRVDNVDMAANVLKIAQRNHQLNDYNTGQAAFYKRDILKSHRWFESREPYDIMIIDPPPYQKKSFNGWKDYKKLLANCRLAIAEGGIMFCCLNNPQASTEEFMEALKETFPEAHKFTVIERAPEILEQDRAKGLKTITIQF